MCWITSALAIVTDIFEGVYMRRFVAAAVVGLVIGDGGIAAASTTTGSFQVTASVVSSATVTATPIAFGNYSGNSAVSADGTVTVSATSGTPYTIGLTSGSGSGATLSARILTGTTSSANKLSYNIFTDSGHTTIWGDGTGGSATASGTGTGTPQVYTMYGQIPAGQSAAPDSYTDTVTVNVTY